MWREPKPGVVEQWKAQADENGSKIITIRALLRAFGLERRGVRATDEIQHWLTERGLHVSGLRVDHENAIDDSIEICRERVHRIGTPVDAERTLMTRFVADMLPKLLPRGRVHERGRGYKPKGTRDKFDFLCIDHDGTPVVVELKKLDGEKRVVEQVLRYIGQLRNEGQFDRDPRGIVITAESDPHTRNALRGQDLDRHIEWWIYGIAGSDELLLERIDVPRASRKAARS